MKAGKLFIKKFVTWMLMFVVLISTFQFTQGVALAAPNVKITTTLVDGALQRGSKKTFDVIARDSNNKKVPSQVTFNGAKLTHTWDDTDKTSYTLKFTKEGSNKVIVTAGGKSISYTLNYKKANKGDVIGTATWSIELFTIGAGYLVQPVNANIIEGETSAHALIRLLHQNGYVGYYGGSLEKAFYLAYIADGTKKGASYNSYKNSNKVEGGPKSPKNLNLTPERIKIPKVLVPLLEESMTYFEQNDYEEQWRGYLGEFVFTNGSGWMYSVNNVFPNVGFADTFLSDGDVVRVQFTLGYGSDIGGASAMGGTIPGAGDNQPTGDYFKVANKDRLTKLMGNAKAKGLLSKANVKSAYDTAMSKVQVVNISQGQIDSAYSTLNNAMSTSSSGGSSTSNKDNLSSVSKPSANDGQSNIGENIAAIGSGKDNTDKDKKADKDKRENGELAENTIYDGEVANSLDNKEGKTIKDKASTSNSWIYWCVGITILVILIALAIVYYIRLQKNKKGYFWGGKNGN